MILVNSLKEISNRKSEGATNQRGGRRMYSITKAGLAVLRYERNKNGNQEAGATVENSQ